MNARARICYFTSGAFTSSTILALMEAGFSGNALFVLVAAITAGAALLEWKRGRGAE